MLYCLLHLARKQCLGDHVFLAALLAEISHPSVQVIKQALVSWVGEDVVAIRFKARVNSVFAFGGRQPLQTAVRKQFDA